MARPSALVRACCIGLAIALGAACSAPERDTLGGGKRSARGGDETTTSGPSARADAGGGSLPSAPQSPPPLDSPGSAVDAGAGTSSRPPDAGTSPAPTPAPATCTAVCAGALGTCGCRLAGVRTMACQGDQCACLESGSIVPTNVFNAAGACDSREEMMAVFTANCGCP